MTESTIKIIEKDYPKFYEEMQTALKAEYPLFEITYQGYYTSNEWTYLYLRDIPKEKLGFFDRLFDKALGPLGAPGSVQAEMKLWIADDPKYGYATFWLRDDCDMRFIKKAHDYLVSKGFEVTIRREK